MPDIGKTSDRGKSQVTSEQKSLDLVRIETEQQEKLNLDSSRRFLPGGSAQEGSSNYGSKFVKDKLKDMNENKENKSKRANDLIVQGKELYKDAKAEEQHKNWEEAYKKYNEKHGGTTYYR
jgi:hypothetical protein